MRPRLTPSLPVLAFSALALAAMAAPVGLHAQGVAVTAPEDGDRIVPGAPFVLSASATSGGALVPPLAPGNTTGPVTGVEFFLVPNRGALGPVPLPADSAATVTVGLGDAITHVEVTNPGSGYPSAPAVTFAPGGAAADANMNGNSVGSITVTAGGAGYAPGPGIVAIDLPPEGAGNVQAQAVAGFSLDPASVAVPTPGSGYDPDFPPPVVLSPPNLPGGRQAVATAVVNPAGQIVGLTITDPGSGYTAAPDVTIPSARDVFSVGTTPLYPFVLSGVTLPGNDRYTLYAVASYLGGGSVESGGGGTGPVVIGEQGEVPQVDFTIVSAPLVPSTSFAVNQPISIQASATFSGPGEASDSIATFDLYVNGVLTDSSTDSSLEFTPATAGFYALYVRATTTRGLISDSELRTVSATQGAPPAIEITAPAESPDPGDPIPVYEMLLNQEVTIRAVPELTQPGSNVQRVEFLFNDQRPNGAAVTPSPADTSLPAGVLGPLGANQNYNLIWRADNAGRYKVVARVTDNLGNITDSEPILINVTQGNTADATLTVSPGSGVKVGQNINASAVITKGDGDIVQAVLLVDGVPAATVGPNPVLAPGPYIYQLQLSAAGDYELKVRVTDALGNVVDSDPVTVNVTTGTPPSVVFDILPGNAVQQGEQVTLRAAPTQGSAALTQVQFFVNGAPFGLALVGPYDLIFNATQVGAQVITARVSDAAGNVVESGPQTLTVNKGTGPSVTSLTVTPSTVVGGRTTEFVAEVTNGSRNLAQVEFLVDGSPVGAVVAAPGPYRFVYQTGATGTFKVTARATDTAGNTGVSAEQTLTVTTGTPPSVVLSVEPNSNVQVGQSVALSAVPTAGSGAITQVEFFANGGSLGVVAAPGPYVLPPLPMNLAGEIEFTARVSDDLGNVVEGLAVLVNVTAGTAPSVVFDILPGNVVQQGEQVTLRAAPTQGSAALTQVEYFANGSSLGVVAAPGPYDLVFPATQIGSLSITARVSDLAGNVVDSGPQTLTVNKGTGPSVTSLTVTPSTVVGGRTTEFVAEVTNGSRNLAQVEFLVDGSPVGAVVAAPGPYRFVYQTGATGTFKVTARATDTAGNTGVSAEQTLTVTTGTPPSVTLSATPTQIESGRSVELSAEVRNGSRNVSQVEFFADGSSVGVVTTYPFNLAYTPTAIGWITFTARATDTAGYVGESNEVAVFVGTVPGTNRTFVIDMYLKILQRNPTDTELAAGQTQLDSGELTRAEFVLNLVQGDEYANSQNRVADFYYTLGVTPNLGDFSKSIDDVKANTALMSGFDDYYPGVIGYWATPPPFDATDGQVTAAKAPLSSPSFVARSLSLQNLVMWIQNRLGGVTLSNPAEVTNRLSRYTSVSDQRGAIVSFLTANYANIGYLWPAMNTAELAYQYQLKATTLRFLLGGPWEPTTKAGTSTVPISRLGNLQVTSQENLLSYIERLLAESTVVLVAPGSAAATATATLGEGVTNIAIVNGGTNYTTNIPPAVTIAAPLATTAVGTGVISNGSVLSVSLTNNTNGYYAVAPAVTVSWPDYPLNPLDPYSSTATAYAQLGTGATAGRVTNIVVTFGGSGYSNAPWVRVEAPRGEPQYSPIQAIAGQVGISSVGAVTNVGLAESGSGYRPTNPEVLIGAPLALQVQLDAVIDFSNRMITNGSLFRVESYVLLTNNMPVATNTTGVFSYTNTSATPVAVSIQAWGTTNLGESAWTYVSTNSLTDTVNELTDSGILIPATAGNASPSTGVPRTPAVPTPTPTPTPPSTPEGITLLKILPPSRTVKAGKSAKLMVMVANNSLQAQNVTVTFSSSNPEVSAPAPLNVKVRGKKSAKQKKGRTGRSKFTVPIPASATGSTVITASVGGLSSTSTLTVKAGKK